AAFADRDRVRGYYDDDAETVFRPIRRFLKRQGIDATFVHRIGNPAEDIARLAEKGKFDLLVMGSHGHGALGNLVLGSVATKVLARCSTPVLLIR
ncbi:MAG: universal stress protein, partial [Caldimonas sp.]